MVPEPVEEVSVTVTWAETTVHMEMNAAANRLAANVLAVGFMMGFLGKVQMFFISLGPAKPPWRAAGLPKGSGGTQPAVGTDQTKTAKCPEGEEHEMRQRVSGHRQPNSIELPPPAKSGCANRQRQRTNTVRGAYNRDDVRNVRSGAWQSGRLLYNV